MSGANKHPYHLVEASPWPAVGSAAAFTAAVGGVMYMHEVAYGVAVLGLGFMLVLATMFMWWRDIIREAEYQGHHTPIVQIGMRYGMMLFIASEVMFFVAFFWAFFDRAFYPNDGVWPPEGIPHVGQCPSSDRNARSQLPHASCDLRSASDLRHAASVSVSGTATSGSRLASTPGVVAPPECISAPGRYEKKIRFPKTRSARSLQPAPACQKKGGSATTTENGV